MTHTVKSGETLTAIAKAHGVTVSQLLDANPSLKKNPNALRVGDILNLPGGGAQAPTPPAPQPQPQPPASRVLGKLSEKYETGGRGPGTVSTGRGDAGGASYGSYQMTSKPSGGTVQKFVTQSDFPFRNAFANLVPGSLPFTVAWENLARSNQKEFQASQHDYIKRTHFDLLVQRILQQNGLNVLTRSFTLQDVIWSTSVQHGGLNDIPHLALQKVRIRPDDRDFDRQFIVAIYTERGRKDAQGALVYFSRNSPKVQQGVARRFQDEQRDALAMLVKEQPV